MRLNLTSYLCAIVEEPTQDELDRWNSNPINEYPLVWTHESGRKSLVMGYTAHHVKGMDLATGKALLQRLHDWAGQPKYVYVHKWQQGDLVIWDNYGTMHRATPYAVDSGREMHRTTIEAVDVLALSASRVAGANCAPRGTKAASSDVTPLKIAA